MSHAHYFFPCNPPAPHALSVVPRMTPSTWYLSASRFPATSISIVSCRGPGVSTPFFPKYQFLMQLAFPVSPLAA